jgi:hypothetical protein
LGTSSPDSYRLKVADDVPALRANSRCENPDRVRTKRR